MRAVGRKGGNARRVNEFFGGRRARLWGGQEGDIAGEEERAAAPIDARRDLKREALVEAREREAGDRFAVLNLNKRR